MHVHDPQPTLGQHAAKVRFEPEADLCASKNESRFVP